jgi:hypothetical protein
MLASQGFAVVMRDDDLAVGWADDSLVVRTVDATPGLVL